MNKIAILMLIHKNINQVKNLIAQFDNNLYDFYIHIDAKYDVEFDVSDYENVYLIERRNISWGSNEMSYAMTDLLNNALNSKKSYSHFMFMSGQCFPIKSTNDIYDYLTSNLDYSFIDFFDYENNYKFQKRTECYYYSWMNKNNTLIKIIKNLYMIFTGGKNHTFKIFKRHFARNFKFAFGSSWICLSYDHAKYVNDYLKDESYLKYFNNALCADECFIHSIIMNSDFKDKVKAGLTYADFNNSRSPRILGVKDYQMLMNLDKYFARKFDENVDKEIIDLLDRRCKHD